MKIIMILDNGYDPDVRVYKEAKYLVGKGFDVDVICWERNKESEKPQEEWHEGIHIIRFFIPSKYGTGIKQLKAYYKFYQTCKNYVNENKCDYLHCHDLTDGIIGMLVHKKTPYVFDMHEYYENAKPRKNSIKHIIVEMVIKNSLASLYENDIYLTPEYSGVREKLFPLKNYPDSNLIKQKDKSESNYFRIGYHGGVRNQIEPFTALFEAVKDMDDVRVDVNGLGIDYEELKKIQENYSNVYVHGAFDGTKELSRLYESTDVLFCGYDPNDPNMQGVAEIVKYYEAVLTGTPMIATKSLAVGMRVENNQFGISVDTNDAKEIKKAIIRLKEDKKFWTNCSENEKRIASQYDWNEAVKILDNIYSN
ncbi:MAG: glycosyltransferase [Firmicutes bacterium]|nr:glycosyltransferase [Bacillota bacterium]